MRRRAVVGAVVDRAFHGGNFSRRENEPSAFAPSRDESKSVQLAMLMLEEELGSDEKRQAALDAAIDPSPAGLRCPEFRQTRCMADTLPL